MTDPMQTQVESDVAAFVTSQATAKPGREVSYGEVVQQLRKKGHSEGEIFEAWKRLRHEGRIPPSESPKE